MNKFESVFPVRWKAEGPGEQSWYTKKFSWEHDPSRNSNCPYKGHSQCLAVFGVVISVINSFNEGRNLKRTCVDDTNTLRVLECSRNTKTNFSDEIVKDFSLFN